MSNKTDSTSFYDEPRREKPSVQAAIEALKSGHADKIPGADIFYGLSDLKPAELAQVKPVWVGLDPVYRRRLMVDLMESSEINLELDYRAIGQFGLKDLDAGVRKAAIDLLWEDDSLELMDTLIRMAKSDSSVEVRAAAASALGRFILAGELEDLPESETIRAQNAVIQLYDNEAEDIDVRRRALEAISNSSHEMVKNAIKAAYRSDDRRMQISAIFAMGRTCDDVWQDQVLDELTSDDAEKRFEATRAAGELSLIEAVPKLARLAVDDDREIQEMAIWALGEIGGKESERVLSELLDIAEENEDDALAELVDDALANVSFVNGNFLGFSLDADD